MRQYTEVATQVRNWTGQEGDSGDLLAGLVAGSGVDGDPARPAWTPHAAAASAAFADFGGLPRHRAGPTGPGEGGRRPRALRPGLPLLPRRHRGPGRDLRLGLAGARPARRRHDGHRRTGSSPAARSTRRWRPSTPTRPGRSRARRRSGTGCRSWPTARSRSWPASTSTSPSRSGGSSAASPRPTTAASTTPARREDFTRPGRMWWSVPDGISRFSPWREVTTVYHEGVPGHHLQVAQTAYRKDLLNRWQRLMCWVSGHGEGWALYAERLMDELGYLADPADRLGHARRAVLPGRPGDRRHRHAPGAGDPPGQPVRLPPGRDLDTRPGAGVHAPALPDGRRVHPLRGQPLPGLAGPGAVVQGGRADLAARPATTRGPARAPTSTSRRSTGPPSTSGRSASTRCVAALARL